MWETGFQAALFSGSLKLKIRCSGCLRDGGARTPNPQKQPEAAGGRTTPASVCAYKKRQPETLFRFQAALAFG
nr:hypothetical protein [uncultured Kingella sp.]